MNTSEAEQWMKEVVAKLPEFLVNMRDSHTPGRYRYALTGDLDFHKRWGLGNSVYAVKIAYMLNRLDLIDIPATTTFINSFQKTDGEISDLLIKQKSYLRRFISALRTGDLNNIYGALTRRAETRQAFAALFSLNSPPSFPYIKIPKTKKETEKYVAKLNWKKPWGAASHINHLIFFLKYNRQIAKAPMSQSENLITIAFKCCDKFRTSDGSWSSENQTMPLYQKINGAMKMMLAYNLAEIDNFEKQKELIDLALSASDTSHACNNLNIICVLYYCSQQMCEYRREEIADYCRTLLDEYRKFYFPKVGGFSFLKGASNRSYYGAIITKGFNEPDLHGTHLFLWGIAMIAEILAINDKINLQLPIT